MKELLKDIVVELVKENYQVNFYLESNTLGVCLTKSTESKQLSLSRLVLFHDIESANFDIIVNELAHMKVILQKKEKEQ